MAQMVQPGPLLGGAGVEGRGPEAPPPPAALPEDGLAHPLRPTSPPSSACRLTVRWWQPPLRLKLCQEGSE